MAKSRQTTQIVLAFFAIYVIWGSTYLLNKIAVADLPPFMLAAVRFSMAGIIVFIIAKSMGISLRITARQLKNVTIAGFLFLSFGNGIVVWALKYVDSGFAALEISAQPLVVLLLMRGLQGKKIQPMSLVGVVLGILGIYLLISQRTIIQQEHSLAGIFMILAAMVSWSYGSLFVGKAELPTNFFVNTGYQMFIGGLFLALMSLIFREAWSLPWTWEGEVQLSMGLLIIFGSIIAFTSFNYLLKVVSPEKVATNTYVNPIVAMVLGWYILDEKITLQSVIAAIVLLTGVYFINTSRQKVGKLNFFKKG